MKVINKQGELLVSNRIANADTPAFYDVSTNKFYRLEPTMAEGTVVDHWVEYTPSGTFFNPGDGFWYVNVPVIVEGQVTDKWVKLQV